MIQSGEILLGGKLISKEIRLEMENTGKNINSRCKLIPSEGEGGEDWMETSEIFIQCKEGLAKALGFIEPKLDYKGVPCFSGIDEL